MPYDIWVMIFFWINKKSCPILDGPTERSQQIANIASCCKEAYRASKKAWQHLENETRIAPGLHWITIYVLIKNKNECLYNLRNACIRFSIKKSGSKNEIKNRLLTYLSENYKIRKNMPCRLFIASLQEKETLLYQCIYLFKKFRNLDDTVSGTESIYNARKKIKFNLEHTYIKIFKIISYKTHKCNCGMGYIPFYCKQCKNCCSNLFCNVHEKKILI